MEHQITINREDFDSFSKVLKVIHSDINYLLLRHGVIHIKIKEDGRIYFNLNNTSVLLGERDKVLRTIFNFYFFCEKNGSQFRNAAFNEKLEAADWYKEYKKLLDAIKSIPAPVKKNKWY